MLAAVAGAVQPPDLTLRVLRRQRVQHGEDGSGSDAGADQQDRRMGLVEDERPAGRRDVEPAADREPVVQVAARGAVVLAFDGDAVVAGARRS